MTRLFAAVACFACIAYLFRNDRRNEKAISGAVWIPFLWMLFAGSRYASQWLNVGSPVSVEDYSEGSPLDRNVFLALLLAAVWILNRRRVSAQAIWRGNPWIVLFFAFAAMSVLWSDEPITAFKRWVKGAGNLAVALLILTERRPFDALGFVVRRLAYLLIPLSILFIRFFPELGRGYHMGEPMFTGVAFSKNSLGQISLIIGVYFLWEFAVKRRWQPPGERTVPSATFAIMLPATAWVLYMSHSATCIGLMLLAVGFLMLVRQPWMIRKPRRMYGLIPAVIVLVGVLQLGFDIKERAIGLLGREPDLTSRTPIWEMLLEMAPNHWVGSGYESFWSGSRMSEIWARLGVPSGGIVQAHNGYIDMYLNLGIVGLSLLLAAIVYGLVAALKAMQRDYPNATLRVLLIVIVVVYNYTEAAYKPVNNMFVLLLISITQIHFARKVKYGRSSLQQASGRT